MTEGNFTDYVKIHVQSGKGGQGSAHLRREKYIPKGGPDGGDGGRGGHIILKANSNMWTLHHLKFKRHLRAGHGGAGSKSTSTGADGEDVYVDVPLGTVVINTDTGKLTKAEEAVMLTSPPRIPLITRDSEGFWLPIPRKNRIKMPPDAPASIVVAII